MPPPLMIAMTLLGAMVVLSSVRMVWIRRQVNVIRLSLLAYGADDEETTRILRLEAMYHGAWLGRIVRLNNLDTSRF